ncbi:MAG: hypothetical protein QM651_07975 [Rhodoblastus sp.]
MTAVLHVILHWSGVALCLAAGVAAFVYLPGRLGMVAVALAGAVGAGLVAYDMGFRARGELDQSANLRAKIAARDEVIAEKDRQAMATRAIAEAASARAQAAQQHSADLQSEIDAYADELAKRPADSRCAMDERDVRGLSAIGRPADPPQPPRRPADVR